MCMHLYMLQPIELAPYIACRALAYNIRVLVVELQRMHTLATIYFFYIILLAITSQ